MNRQIALSALVALAVLCPAPSFGAGRVGQVPPSPTATNQNIVSVANALYPGGFQWTPVSLPYSSNGSQVAVGGVIDTSSRFSVNPQGASENGIIIRMPSGYTGMPLRVLNSTGSIIGQELPTAKTFHFTSQSQATGIVWGQGKNYVFVDTSSGSITVNLPALISGYQDTEIYIRLTSGANALYVQGATSSTVILTGTTFGTGGSAGSTYDLAWDGNIATFFDAVAASGGYTGIDVGSGSLRSVNRVRYYPRPGFAGRMNGGLFQGSNDSSTWTTFYTISATPSDSAWTDVSFTATAFYRYFRYISPSSYCNVNEIQLYQASSPEQIDASASLVTVTSAAAIEITPDQSGNTWRTFKFSN
jgi:hypothetical protein